jgi:hypothetical protein
MEPLAVVISAVIDFDRKQVYDVLWQFVDFGDDPIESANQFVESVRLDFPRHTHIIRSNRAAQEVHKRAVMNALGVIEECQSNL